MRSKGTAPCILNFSTGLVYVTHTENKVWTLIMNKLTHNITHQSFFSRWINRGWTWNLWTAWWTADRYGLGRWNELSYVHHEVMCKLITLVHLYGNIHSLTLSMPTSSRIQAQAQRLSITTVLQDKLLYGFIANMFWFIQNNHHDTNYRHQNKILMYTPLKHFHYI